MSLHSCKSSMLPVLSKKEGDLVELSFQDANIIWVEFPSGTRKSFPTVHFCTFEKNFTLMLLVDSCCHCDGRS